jgi:hypothetical protein
VIAFLIALNAPSSSVPQLHLTSFRVRVVRGFARELKLSTHLRRKLAKPKKDCSCLTVVGIGHLVNASIFSFSMLIPSGLMLIPIKEVDVMSSYTMT